MQNMSLHEVKGLFKLPPKYPLLLSNDPPKALSQIST